MCAVIPVYVGVSNRCQLPTIPNLEGLWGIINVLFRVVMNNRLEGLSGVNKEQRYIHNFNACLRA